MTALELIQTPDHIDLSFDSRPVLRYVYQPQTPQLESPRPYFHPLYSLAGNNVTDFRPQDHPWHHGLSMTAPFLSGENFWGGPTYIRHQGYIQLPNNGSQQHVAWDVLEYTATYANMVHRLRWITQAGQPLLDERRAIYVDSVRPETGAWSLGIEMQLTNVTDNPLVFGSPATEGRDKAGYGGLFLRAAPVFLAGEAFLSGGAAAHGREDVLLGRRTPWLALVARGPAPVTLILVDQFMNPRYPNPWFLRLADYPGASFAFMFDEPYTLLSGVTLSLAYRLIIADGAYTSSSILTLLDNFR